MLPLRRLVEVPYRTTNERSRAQINLTRQQNFIYHKPDVAQNHIIVSTYLSHFENTNDKKK